MPPVTSGDPLLVSATAAVEISVPVNFFPGESQCSQGQSSTNEELMSQEPTLKRVILRCNLWDFSEGVWQD